jgi:uncharacterized membrane protein
VRRCPSKTSPTFVTAEGGLQLLSLSIASRGSIGTPAQRLGICDTSVAAAFDLAANLCFDHFERKRQVEYDAAMEESRREFQAALRGVELP